MSDDAGRGSQRPVKVALAGAGQFGMTLAAASAHTADVELVAVADLDPTRARSVLALAASGAARAAEVGSAREGNRCLAAGQALVTADAAVLAGLEVDVVVEATGHPEAGAQLALAAIEGGRHVVMASKEVESVVGPVLSARAREAGVVYTMVEGDQPSLLVGLVERARRMGLRIVAAGKATEHDLVWSASAGRVSSQGRSVAAPQMAALWHLGADAGATLAARAEQLAGLPGRTAADLCEMGVTANALEMLPATEALAAPPLRVPEVPEIARAARDGGLLPAEGRLAVFQCLRREDEAGFAGGVFVVVEWPAGETARVLAGKGIPSSRDGRLGMLHNPVHLLGVEALVSILAAAREGRATARARRPLVDLVVRAERDFAAGETLAMGGHFHEIEGADARLVPASPLAAGSAVPYHLASNATLARAVRAGSILRLGDLLEPAASTLWRLRREQDALYA